MRKLGITIGAIVFAVVLSSCGVQLSNDMAADLVAKTVVGATQISPSSDSMGMFALSTLWEDWGIEYSEVTNADGSITISFSYDGFSMTTTVWERSYADNWASEKFEFSMSGTEGGKTYSISMDTDMNERFLLNGDILPVTDDNSFWDASFEADEFHIYASFDMSAKKGSETYTFKGKYGESKSKPFKYKETDTTTTLNGVVSYNVTTSEFDDAFVYFDYKNVTLSYFGYPNGTVNGYVKADNEEVSFKLIFNGTVFATLEVGNDKYSINIMTGSYSKIS